MVGAVCAIALANVIGGATYLGQKLALDGLPPITISMLRSVIAVGCLSLWAARSGGLRLSFTRREHGRLALLGMTAYALPLVLGVVGLRWSTAGNGSLLILLEPPAILIFSRILLGERVRGAQAIGVGLGLLGALRIVLEEAQPGELLASDLLLGNLILAAHGILWGLFSPLMAPLMARHRAQDLTFMAIAWSLLLLVPASLFEADQWSKGPHLLSSLGWTTALGVVGSFAGTLLWVGALRELTPGVVAPFVFLQPVAGVLAGHLVLGERLSSDALLGGLLVAAGVLCVIWPRRRAPGLSAPS